MLPWHIRLSKGLFGTGDGTSGALMSTYELKHRHKGTTDVANKPMEPRNVLFGLSGVSFAPQQAVFKGQHQAMQNVQRQQQVQQQYLQQQMQQPQAHAAPQQRSAPGGGGDLFGHRAQPPPGSLFGGFGANTNGASSTSMFGHSTSENPSSEGTHALMEHQEQLMLLEQQNKQRLLLARQEQDALSGADRGGEGFAGYDTETIVPDLPTLGTQESEWNESG